MSFKKRKKKLWSDASSVQSKIDKIEDANTKSVLTDEMGTLVGLLDSIKPTDEIYEGRDMLGFCREELEKIKNKLCNGQEKPTTNWRKEVVRDLRKKKEERKIGFQTSIGQHTIVDSRRSTPPINDLKLVENLVCLKEGENSTFKLIFNKDTYSKMQMYTKLINLEITGLLEVRVENNRFYIDDIHLFRQVVSGAQCEAEDDLALVELMNDMIAKGKNPSSLKCWWHSHNTMGTSPSGTDVATAEKFANKEFLITLITNHRGEMYTKLNFYKPILFEIEDLSVYVDYSSENKAQMLLDCKTEIEKMVKTSYSTPSYPQYAHPWAGSYGYDVSMGDYNEFDSYPIYPGQNYQKLETIKEVQPNLLRSVVGDCYVEAGLKYVWNPMAEEYLVYNSASVLLTDEELKALGARSIDNDIEDGIETVGDLYNK